MVSVLLIQYELGSFHRTQKQNISNIPEIFNIINRFCFGR